MTFRTFVNSYFCAICDHCDRLRPFATVWPFATVSTFCEQFRFATVYGDHLPLFATVYDRLRRLRKICNNLRPFATICDRLEPFKTVCGRLRLFATACDDLHLLQRFAIVCESLRSFATVCDQLQPFEWSFVNVCKRFERLLPFGTVCDHFRLFATFATFATFVVASHVSSNPAWCRLPWSSPLTVGQLFRCLCLCARQYIYTCFTCKWVPGRTGINIVCYKFNAPKWLHDYYALRGLEQVQWPECKM